MFDGDNKWYEDAAYTVGALANLQDVTAGPWGTNVNVNSNVKGEWWGHSSVTGDNINVSVGPLNQVNKWSAFKLVPGNGKYQSYAGEAGTWSVPLNNVNSKVLQSITTNLTQGRGALGLGSLQWNLNPFACVNYSSRALWAAGVPTLPINFHPLILNAQLSVRQMGIYASPYVIIRK